MILLSVAKIIKLIKFMKQDEIILQVQNKKNHEIEFVQLSCVKDLNLAIANGHSKDVINMTEIVMDHHINNIATSIASSPDKRLVLISGPSSSGKTTFSKRLTLHLMANHLKPYPISLDDYFVDRARTPKDETGDYDYESLYALDLELLQRHTEQLLRGEEIELPHYNFQTGQSQKSGIRLHLEDDMILIFEGIHGLNPELTSLVPDKYKFKIYASVLAPIMINKEKSISLTDCRLIRRILRDYRYRGATPQSTIDRWPSVRRGEDKWVFPFQKNADVEFNSAAFYEMAVLRNRVLPILAEISPDQPEYEVSDRLRKLLLMFSPIEDTGLTPPTSLLREFMGGSSFRY